jgi:hypothetical protein
VTGISGHCLASDMDFDPLHGADEVLMESVELFWYLVTSHYHTYYCCWLTQNMLVSVAVVHTGVRGILDLVLLTGQYHTCCFQRPLKVCVGGGIVHTIPLFLYVNFSTSGLLWIIAAVVHTAPQFPLCISEFQSPIFACSLVCAR